MKTIYMENGVIMYYGSRVGQIADGCAVVDPLFQGPELQDFLDKQKHIREVKWMDGIYDRLMNAPKEKLDEIVSVLPGMKSPTVMPLAQEGWCSVHTVLDEKCFWEIIGKLKALGAEGILVLPIEKMII